MEKHSGRHAFEDRINALGYSLSREDLDEAFKKFKVLADKKKLIKDRDIESIILKDTETEDRKLELESFVINTGNDITNLCYKAEGKRKDGGKGI